MFLKQYVISAYSFVPNRSRHFPIFGFSETKMSFSLKKRGKYLLKCILISLSQKAIFKKHKKLTVS